MRNRTERVKAAQLLPGQFYESVPLASMTTWKIGGPAEKLYLPKNLFDLMKMLAALPEKMPVTFLGLGSNVLISDEGVLGVVVLLTKMPQALYWKGKTLIVGAGITCAKLARYSDASSLSFMAGIPGSVGGALAMNAGAFGGQTWSQVCAVDMVDRQGVLHHLPASAFQAGYRSLDMPFEGYFVKAYFQPQKQDDLSAAAIKALLQKRAKLQPIGLPSCGSVFKNPPGDHAARLIEACGLKGYSVGQASVSTKHANFIINKGGATAEQVLSLIEIIVQRVYDRFTITLQTEVRWLGSRGKLHGRNSTKEAVTLL